MPDHDPINPTSPTPQTACVQRCWQHLGQADWAGALAVLEGLDEADPAVGMPRRMARNLACLAEYRPKVAAVLARAQPAQVAHHFALHRTGSGRYVPAARLADGRFAPTSPADDPVAAAQTAFEHL